jgi:hypothetical protein
MQFSVRTLALVFAAGLTGIVGGCAAQDSNPGQATPAGSGGSGSGGKSGGSGGGSGGKSGSGGSGPDQGSGGQGSGGSGSGGQGSTSDGGTNPQPDAAPDPDEPPDAGSGPSDDGGGTPPASDGGTTGPVVNGCTLLWSPSAMRDGEKAFELAEMPDVQLPGGSGPTHGGVKHITAVAEHDAYRIDSHYMPPGAADFDRVTLTGPTRTDRLRCETRGMVGPTGQVDMLNGQTWRITWSFYLPATLKGTSRFTHIMQMKYVDAKGGVSGSPIVTLTLRPGDKMEFLLWLGGGSVSTVDVSGMHDKWLSADMTLKIAPQGSVHWILKDGDKVVVDKQQAGVIWPPDGGRLRPKWGIYRGVADGVVSTYMMLSDLKAYRCP